VRRQANPDEALVRNRSWTRFDDSSSSISSPVGCNHGSPGTSYPRAKTFTFSDAAAEVGLAPGWIGESKLPAVASLLESAQKRAELGPLVLIVVREASSIAGERDSTFRRRRSDLSPAYPKHSAFAFGTSTRGSAFQPLCQALQKPECVPTWIELSNALLHDLGSEPRVLPLIPYGGHLIEENTFDASDSARNKSKSHPKQSKSLTIQKRLAASSADCQSRNSVRVRCSDRSASTPFHDSRASRNLPRSGHQLRREDVQRMVQSTGGH